MAKDLKSLIELGENRGYKNPYFWAKTILKKQEKTHFKYLVNVYIYDICLLLNKYVV